MIINKIYHLADLHIRNLQRHKEYKEVFKKFLKQVEDDKIEDSIMVTSNTGIDKEFNVTCKNCSDEFKSSLDLNPTTFFA